jgi:hypothetical protein
MTQPQITVVPPVAVEPPAALLPPLATESPVHRSLLAQLQSWSTQIESSNVDPISFLCTKISISISRNWNCSIVACDASSVVGVKHFPAKCTGLHSPMRKPPQPDSGYPMRAQRSEAE